MDVNTLSRMVKILQNRVQVLEQGLIDLKEESLQNISDIFKAYQDEVTVENNTYSIPSEENTSSGSPDHLFGGMTEGCKAQE